MLMCPYKHYVGINKTGVMGYRNVLFFVFSKFLKLGK